MKNSKYWKKRFELLEDSLHKNAIDVFKRNEELFEMANKEIEQQISVWYQRFATNNELSIKDAKKLLTANELKELKWDIQEYIKYGRENDLNNLWMKELENASAKYHISRLEALKLQTRQTVEALYQNENNLVDTMVKKTYSDGYYHTCYEIQKGFNVGWDIGTIDQRQLQKIISEPWTSDEKIFSDRIWQSKNQLVSELHNELTRTCLLGKSPDSAIKNISKKFQVSKNQAGRLIMTEQAYFQSLSQKDAFNELDVEKFENVATLDSHTSAICQDMDGTVFDMKDYEPGGTAPPFHPYCRTVTVPYFEDEFELGERAAKGEDGKTYYVPSDLKYSDWKKQYASTNKQVSKIDNSKNNAKIKKESNSTLPQMIEDNAVLKNSINYLDLTDETNQKIFNNVDKLNITAMSTGKRSCYRSAFRRIEIPKTKDLDSARTSWHELGHAIDNFDKKLYMSNNPRLNKVIDEFNIKGGQPKQFVDYINNLKGKVQKRFKFNEDDIYEDLKKIYQDKIHDDAIRRAAKERLNSKIVSQMNKLADTEKEYAGFGSVSDIFSCLSKGAWNNSLKHYGYHEKSYLRKRDGAVQTEVFANYVSLRMLNLEPELKLLKETIPDIYDELEDLYKEMGTILEDLK